MLRGEWSKGAVCSSTDPEVFFAKGRHLKAKAVCVGCPVISECLTESLDDEIAYGVWGGATAPERLEMMREEFGPGYNWPALGDTAMVNRDFCAKGGHLLTGDNVMPTATGGRRCRECKRARDAEAYDRKTGIERRGMAA